MDFEVVTALQDEYAARLLQRINDARRALPAADGAFPQLRFPRFPQPRVRPDGAGSFLRLLPDIKQNGPVAK